MKKIHFLLVTTAILYAGFFYSSALAESGTCGADCTWTFENGHLDIQGSGDMSWSTGYTVKKSTYDGKTYDWSYGGLLNKKAPWGNLDIRTVNIGKDITSIGAVAFLNQGNITSITFEEGSKLKTVGDFAFASTAENVQNFHLSLPDSVENIGFAAIAIGSKDTVNGNYTVDIPKSLKSMGSWEFYYSGVKNIDFSKAENLTSIGPGMVLDSMIESVVLPPNLVEIPYAAFFSDTNLKNITLPETLQTIGAFAFKKTGLEDIIIPKNVTSIGEQAFSNCSDLSSIDITAAKDLAWANNALSGVAESAKLICKEAQIKEGVCTKDALTRAAFNGTLIGKGRGYYAEYDKDGNIIGYYASLADIDKGISITKAQADELANALLQGCKGYCSIEDALKWIKDTGNVVSVTW